MGGGRMVATCVINRDFWRDRRILLTGHTGFKGGWLAHWLHRLDAKVYGLALPPATSPNLFTQARVSETVANHLGDIRDARIVNRAFDEAQPEVVIHMAAQPLVLESYRSPTDTFATNVMGTVHVLDAVRRSATVRAVIVVTTDKCYENREWPWPYRETDRLGGHDCYASSKACAEIATSAFVSSFLTDRRVGAATVRAGNVIGGGDWSANRLIPDAVRAFLEKRPLVLRHPAAIRPWQHVLEPLHAYLALSERIFTEPARWSGAWNIGPPDALSVTEVVRAFTEAWGEDARWDTANTCATHHEAGTLRLDTSKARHELGWQPRLRTVDAVEWTARWYKTVAANGDGAAATCADIARYEALAS
jgi:CDP-glucose 4,6-dehydratase